MKQIDSCPMECCYLSMSFMLSCTGQEKGIPRIGLVQKAIEFCGIEARKVLLDHL